MHAIVLAGGYATRLWPITKNRPKMLLPIGDQTVIGTIFDALERDDRIDDVYVSTNEKFAEEFESYLQNSKFEKPQLSIEDTTAESEKFGVVGALAQLVDRENLTDDTLVVAGDNLISFDIADFLDTFEANGEPTLASYDVGSYERASSYGLVELNDDNEVIDFQEKPDDPKSTLVSIACYGFPGETLPKLDEYLAGDNNPDEPGWFLQWLQDRETVHAFTLGSGGSSGARSSDSRTGSESETRPQVASRTDERRAERAVSRATRETEAWFDIGTPESYLDAIAWHLDGESYVHPSADVEDATIGENVQVMGDATLEDVTVENSVIFPEATIRGGELRRSLIDEDTHIEGLNLSGAVIGAHTVERVVLKLTLQAGSLKTVRNNPWIAIEIPDCVDQYLRRSAWWTERANGLRGSRTTQGPQGAKRPRTAASPGVRST